MGARKRWLVVALGAALGVLAALAAERDAAGQGVPQFAAEMVAAPDAGTAAAARPIYDVRTPRSPHGSGRGLRAARQAAAWLLGIDILERSPRDGGLPQVSPGVTDGGIHGP